MNKHLSGDWIKRKTRPNRWSGLGNQLYKPGRNTQGATDEVATQYAHCEEQDDLNHWWKILIFWDKQFDVPVQNENQTKDETPDNYIDVEW